MQLIDIDTHRAASAATCHLWPHHASIFVIDRSSRAITDRDA